MRAAEGSPKVMGLRRSAPVCSVRAAQISAAAGFDKVGVTKVVEESLLWEDEMTPRGWLGYILSELKGPAAGSPRGEIPPALKDI